VMIITAVKHVSDNAEREREREREWERERE
jgi:hypothetical protein